MVEHTERLDGGARVALDRRGRRRATPCAPPATTCRSATRCSTAGRGAHARPPRRAGQRRRARGRWSHPGPASACCPPATSWSTTARPLAPGQIRESNRPTLLALRRRGRLSRRSTSASSATTRPPSTAAIARRRRHAATRSSPAAACRMGDFDLVKVVLDRIGDMRWMQIAIQPGQAVRLRPSSGDGPTPVFGLPGNPVSSMVSFELLARPGPAPDGGPPATARPPRGGRPSPTRRCAGGPDGKIHFARVRGRAATPTGVLQVRSAGGQGSHQLAAMAAADGARRCCPTATAWRPATPSRCSSAPRSELRSRLGRGPDPVAWP